MNETTQLKLPLLQPAQAQKHVTVNEALALLDQLVQMSVSSAQLHTPPAFPTEGVRYIVAAPATDAWLGQEGRVAAFFAGGWVFHQPAEGWLVWDAAQQHALVYTGDTWRALIVKDDTRQTDALGIGTAPDDLNRFVFSGTNALMTSDGSLDLTMNKTGAEAEASMSFKSDYVLRAMFGLLGNDEFSMKIRTDAGDYKTALALDGQSAMVRLPEGLVLGGGGSEPEGVQDGAIWYDAALPGFQSRVNGHNQVLGAGGGGAVGGDVVAPPLVLAKSGTWITPTTSGLQNLPGVSSAPDRCELFPFAPLRDIDATKLGLVIITQKPAALGRIVIYGSDADFYPAGLLYESPDLDLSSAGTVTTDLSFRFELGRGYWLGFWSNSYASVASLLTNATPDLPSVVPTRWPAKVLRVSWDYSTTAPTVFEFENKQLSSSRPAAIWIKNA